jgi:hypothetical protein
LGKDIGLGADGREVPRSMVIDKGVYEKAQNIKGKKE